MENTYHTVNFALFQDKGLGQQETYRKKLNEFMLFFLYIFNF